MEIIRNVINKLQSLSWIKDWIEDCTLSSARDSAKFEITDAKLHVLIFTLSTKGIVNLAKQLDKGFKRSIGTIIKQCLQ